MLAMNCGVAVRADQSVTLAWDPSGGPGIAGYRLHYGLESSNYVSVLLVGLDTRVTVAGLTEGMTYYFVVTAYDGFGLESEPSEELSYTVPIASVQLSVAPVRQPPGAFQLSFQGIAGLRYQIQASEDLRTWVAIAEVPEATGDERIEYVDSELMPSGRRFYRVLTHGKMLQETGVDQDFFLDP